MPCACSKGRVSPDRMKPPRNLRRAKEGSQGQPETGAVPRLLPGALQSLVVQEVEMLVEHPCRQWEDRGIKPMFTWPFPPSSLLAALPGAEADEPHLFWKSHLFSNPLL